MGVTPDGSAWAVAGPDAVDGAVETRQCRGVTKFYGEWIRCSVQLDASADVDLCPLCQHKVESRTIEDVEVAD